jgi:hypothetical protein
MAEPGFSTRPPIRRAALQVLPGGVPHRPAGTDASASGTVRVYVLGLDPLARVGIRSLLDGRPALDVVLCHGTAPAAPLRAPGHRRLRNGARAVHGQLPATVTADQPAAAIVLAAAGYTVLPRPDERPPAQRVRTVSDTDPATLTEREQNLLGKLRLRNRLHAAIYAFETGLRTAR